MSAVAWSPAGDRVATADNDAALRVWDTTTGKLVWHRLLAPIVSPFGWASRAVCVGFTPDGTRVVTAGRRDDLEKHTAGLVLVLDAKTGKTLVECRINRDIRAAAMSPDGKALVAATSYGGLGETALHGVDLATGNLIFETPQERGKPGLWSAEDIQFGPKSDVFFVAAGNSEILKFDARTGTELKRIAIDWRTPEQVQARKPQTPQLWNGDFTPDARTLVSCSGAFVHVWDVETGKLRRRIHHPHEHGSTVSVSPDGKTVATSDLYYVGDYGVDTLRLYDVDSEDPASSNEPVLTLESPGNRASILQFSPESTRLFTGFFRGSAIIWDVRR